MHLQAPPLCPILRREQHRPDRSLFSTETGNDTGFESDLALESRCAYFYHSALPALRPGYPLRAETEPTASGHQTASSCCLWSLHRYHGAVVAHAIDTLARTQLFVAHMVQVVFLVTL